MATRNPITRQVSCEVYTASTKTRCHEPAVAHWYEDDAMTYVCQAHDEKMQAQYGWEGDSDE